MLLLFMWWVCTDNVACGRVDMTLALERLTKHNGNYSLSWLQTVPVNETDIDFTTQILCG